MDGLDIKRHFKRTQRTFVWRSMNSFCCTLWREVIVYLRHFFSKRLRQGEEKETATLHGVMIVLSSIWEVILHRFEIFGRGIIFRIVSVFSLQYFIQTQPVNQDDDHSGDQLILTFAGQLVRHSWEPQFCYWRGTRNVLDSVHYPMGAYNFCRLL